MIQDTINIYNIYILDEKYSWIVENFRTIITTRERESGRARIKIFKGCVAIPVEPEVIAAGVHKGGVKHTGS